MSKVLVISFSDLSSDPRLDRQIAALRTRHRVVAAGLGPPAYPDVEFVDISIKKFPGEITAPISAIVRRLRRDYEAVYWKHPANKIVFPRLRDLTADVVIANDLHALPMALALGAPVVLDAHEYAPDELGGDLRWELLMRPLVRYLGLKYIPQAAAMMTVSDGVADAYERFVGIRPVVVRNEPPFADLQPSEVGEPIRILHHGAAVRARRLEEMVRLADLLDERFTLDLVLMEASPGFRDELVAKARHNPRVRFPPPVPMRELPQMANGYDIGVYLLPPDNLNHRFALPNKFFEFVQGRLALAIGPSPEMARLVNQYRCGVVAEDFSAEALAAVLNELDASQIAEFKQASHLAAVDLCAEHNVPLILEAVEVALGVGSEARPSFVPSGSDLA